MNTTQTAEFVAASGYNPAIFSALAISLLVAIAFLWSANVIRKLGNQALLGHMRQKQFVFYAVRVMILVMLVVYLCT
jgi:integrating conjugative element protein (TIGR03758 family)